MAGMDWRFLAAAAGIVSFSTFVRSLRWRILLNAEAALDVMTVFWATAAGYLGNNFLPARAGELLRSLLISSRSKLSTTYVLTTALSERLMDVIALVLWTSIALMGMSAKPRWVADVSRTMAFVAGAGAVVIAILPHTGRLLETILERIPLPPGIRQRLLKLAGQIMLGAGAFHNWGRFFGFAGLTAVIWPLDCLTTITLARGMGIDISFSVAMLLIAGLGLSSALPSTPGYVGVYQFVAVTVLAPFGVARDAALAFILVFQAIGYVVVTVFGVPGLYKLRGTASLARWKTAG